MHFISGTWAFCVWTWAFFLQSYILGQLNQNKLWEELALHPIQIIYIMHIMFCNLVWALKEWPHPMWQETWLRTSHLPFHMCKRVWAWDCTQTEYWPRRQRKPVHAWIYMVLVSPKFFLLAFSACVLSHRKSSDKWEELSHNYVLRTVYQGGFPSLELVEALHSSLNLQ